MYLSIYLTKSFLFFFFLFRLQVFLFFNFILFLNLKHCISFAKHQNESATGIHVLPILILLHMLMICIEYVAQSYSSGSQESWGAYVPTLVSH